MAALGKKSVKIFYDVISPYAWLAFEVLLRQKPKWNLDVHLKPVLFGGILKATGNIGPAVVPARLLYMKSDIPRLAKLYQVPVVFPSDPLHVLLKKGTLAPQRVLSALDMSRPDLTEALSRELWMRIWHRDEDITEPASFLEAGMNIGLGEGEMKEILAAAKEQPAKDRLTAVTKEAADAGAFGVPTMVAKHAGQSHLVFGCDRFQILADLLGEKFEY